MQADLNYIRESGYPKLADWMGFDNFVDNQGYDYAGIYAWHFIETYGFEKIVAVYRNECEWQQFIYENFELEAIQSFVKLETKFKKTIR